MYAYKPYVNKSSNLFVFLVASFTVNFSYIFLFGMSGRGLIFMYAFQLLCYSLYMTTTVESRERMAMWFLTGFHVLLVYNQIPYMTNTVQGKEFTIFFCSVSAIISIWLLLAHMKDASDLYRFRSESVSELKEGRIYLVVKRPKTFKDFLKSLTGDMTDSVSYSIGYDWIVFSKTKNKAVILRGDLDCYGYSFFDTGLVATDRQKEDFKNLVGYSPNFFDNCLTFWRGFLDGTVYEPKPFELTPTSYLKRVLWHTTTVKESL